MYKIFTHCVVVYLGKSYIIIRGNVKEICWLCPLGKLWCYLPSLSFNSAPIVFSKREMKNSWIPIAYWHYHHFHESTNQIVFFLHYYRTVSSVSLEQPFYNADLIITSLEWFLSEVDDFPVFLHSFTGFKLCDPAVAWLLSNFMHMWLCNILCVNIRKTVQG